MIINHNLNSMNAHRNMSFNTTQTGKAMEKLSSGLRINRAGDDAAGLAISEKMRGQIRGLDQASRNAQDGISLIQTAEGALNETHSILQRMRELAVQSSNDSNNDNDRVELQKEVAQLKEEVDRIAKDTQFNNKALLDGTLGTKLDLDTANSTVLTDGAVDAVSYSGGLSAGTWTLAGGGDGSYTLSDGAGTSYTSNAVTAGSAGTLSFDGKISIDVNNSIADDALNALAIEITGTEATFHIGANKDESIGLSINDMSQSGLSLTAVDISTQSGANDAITVIQTAIDKVSSERSMLGAKQNRLEHTINNLNVGAENLQAAESRIRDVDMAKEMMNFTKNNILNQAAQAMLAQAKSQPEAVLQLLR